MVIGDPFLATIILEGSLLSTTKIPQVPLKISAVTFWTASYNVQFYWFLIKEMY